jgi:hypothetical protein
MSDPTPTDVQALVDRLRLFACGLPTPCGRCDGCVIRAAADALTALRLDVQRITEERDRLAADYDAAKLIIGATLQQAPKHEADRDAQVREAFMAARRARKWHGVWSFDERTGLAADIVDRDDAEAFAAYLRERQDGKETAK